MIKISICDFLPTFIDFDKDTERILGSNLVDHTSLYHKKEYQRYKLEKEEASPTEPGQYMNHQIILSQFLSGNTPYNGILVMHEPGTGKTCLSISIIEKMRNEFPSFKGALVLMKGETLIRNYKKELVDTCTDGRYKITDEEDQMYGYDDEIDELDKMRGELTDKKKVRRINKKVAEYYDFQTFEVFCKMLSEMTDKELQIKFSNLVIVIDEAHHIRITDVKEKDNKDRYNNLHRMLHIVKNVKIILMTGTPMVDKPSEIASLLNLFLPLKDQLPTGDDFNETYMIEEKGTFVINPEKTEELREKLYGKVSFLRSMQSIVKREFIGERLDLEYFNQFPMRMVSDGVQIKHYKEALKKDRDGKGIYINSREANLFVFPNGTYGSEGFKKYTKTRKTAENKIITTISDSIFDPYKGVGSIKEKLEILSRYSIKYATCIKMLLEKEGNHFVYMDFVEGSGAIIFAKLLENFGFNQFKKGQQGGKNTFALLTSKTSSDINKVLSVFNSDENVIGNRIKIIIGTKIVSEGFTFKNVQNVHILTPHWNFSETDQAIARAFRFASHRALEKYNEKEHLPDPIVSIYLYTTIVDENDTLKQDTFSSIDRYMYKFCEDKDISIKSIEYILKTISFDCRLTKTRNVLPSTLDYSRYCEYKPCNYVCYKDDDDDEKGEKPIDYSTYNLYYDSIDMALLIDHFKLIFSDKSYYTLSELYEKCSTVPKYLVIKTIIFCKENKIIINEEKGIKMFLYYEKENIFLSYAIENATFLDTFYSTHIPLQLQFDIDTYIMKHYDKNFPILFKKLKEEENLEQKDKILNMFTDDAKQMILQYCILSDFLNIENVSDIREYIMKKLKSYYFDTENIIVTSKYPITKAKDIEEEKYKEKLTCLDKTKKEEFKKSIVSDDFSIQNIWSKCKSIKYLKDESMSDTDSDSDFSDDLDSELNKFGYQGFDEEGKFKIKKIVEKNKDDRKNPSGFVCVNAKKNILLEIIDQFKIDPESMNKKEVEKTEDQLRDYIKSKEPDIKLDIENMLKDDLIRLSYWVQKTRPQLCQKIKEVFKKNGIFSE